MMIIVRCSRCNNDMGIAVVEMGGDVDDNLITTSEHGMCTKCFPEFFKDENGVKQFDIDAFVMKGLARATTDER